jgi:signal transduction histidine kinase
MELPSPFRIERWGVGAKLLAFTIPPIVLLTFLITWAVYVRSATSLEQKMTARARAIHTQIMADREYYSSVIVPRILELGGTLDSQYHDVRGGLPLPATFVREASEIAARREGGYAAHVISPWAINKNRGLKDQFHHEAFSALAVNPNQQLLSIDKVEDRAVMRVLMADVASAQSCVDCHNAHPESPKHDFKLHDLMGGLEVIMPIERYLQESRQDLFLTVSGGIGMFLLLAGIIVTGTRRFVAKPLNQLASDMRNFAATEDDSYSSSAESRLHGDEVGALAATYDRMQAVIVKQRHELQVANARLGEQVTELKAANHELEAFSYSVSHDLRAPLRSMDGFSKILIEEYADGMPEEARHFLLRVRENAQKMDQLVKALLDLSRLQRQVMAVQTVEPRQIVEEVLGELTGEDNGREIEITVGTLPSCIADRVLLKQVYTNLISNALKFTRTQAVAKITVDCRSENGLNTYLVQDNGVGFDMRYVEKLFGAFQRLHRAEEFAGTGIGLATVKRIILRHGGDVWAESVVGQGTAIFFTLSRRKAA